MKTLLIEDMRDDLLLPRCLGAEVEDGARLGDGSGQQPRAVRRHHLRLHADTARTLPKEEYSAAQLVSGK